MGWLSKTLAVQYFRGINKMSLQCATARYQHTKRFGLVNREWSQVRAWLNMTEPCSIGHQVQAGYHQQVPAKLRNKVKAEREILRSRGTWGKSEIWGKGIATLTPFSRLPPIQKLRSG